MKQVPLHVSVSKEDKSSVLRSLGWTDARTDCVWGVGGVIETRTYTYAVLSCCTYALISEQSIHIRFNSIIRILIMVASAGKNQSLGVICPDKKREKYTRHKSIALLLNRR